jgi:hypothetical protein
MLSISLGDILKVLEQFKAWPRMTAAPDRIDALEKRVAALETRLAAPARPRTQPCEFCDEGNLRLQDEKLDPGPFGRLGRKIRVLKCDQPDCGRTIERYLDP